MKKRDPDFSRPVRQPDKGSSKRALRGSPEGTALGSALAAPVMMPSKPVALEHVGVEGKEFFRFTSVPYQFNFDTQLMTEPGYSPWNPAIMVPVLLSVTNWKSCR